MGNNRVVAEANGTVVQKTYYYPFGMAFAESMGEKEQPYKYNGKELDRRLQLNTYDYEARYMDPAIGRFTSIDPLAENYYSISPYTYVANNPLKYIDPTGMVIDDYFNQNGTYLYTDNLKTDNLRIVEQKDWDQLLMSYPGQGETMSYRDFDEALQNKSTPIQDTKLSAEAYSNIFTSILSSTDGVDLNKMYNNKVSVVVSGKVLIPTISEFNNPYVGNGNAYTLSINGKIQITSSVSVNPGSNTDNTHLFSTRSNVQNLLGVHEYIGHGVKGWDDATNTHYKAYDLQMSHPTWNKTTPAFKKEMKSNASQYNHQRSR